ncbi:MAG: hypothetical protein ACNA7J_08190 [Wenzhouxiangella sp.]
MRNSPSNLITWQDLTVLPILKPHAVRDLRAALMELAGWLANQPEHRGLLLLLDNRLSTQRLEEEMFSASKALQPSVFARIQVLELPNQYSLEVSLREAGLANEEALGVAEALREVFTRKPAARSPRSAYDLVFEHLVNAYLLHLGPMTTESIMSSTGFSYPPVADALGKLAANIQRYSDRRVELKHFPRQEWSRFVSVYERGQFCKKFTVAHELARSPKNLLMRFQKFATSYTAVSGVQAAHHYDPEFDLVGSSRLDICITGTWLEKTSTLARKIDPALEPAPFNTTNPILVVWPVHRPETLFQPDPTSDIHWADPVSCLLALHDARLEAQAEELIHVFEQGNARTWAEA